MQYAWDPVAASTPLDAPYAGPPLSDDAAVAAAADCSAAATHVAGIAATLVSRPSSAGSGDALLLPSGSQDGCTADPEQATSSRVPARAPDAEAARVPESGPATMHVPPRALAQVMRSQGGSAGAVPSVPVPTAPSQDRASSPDQMTNMLLMDWRVKDSRVRARAAWSVQRTPAPAEVCGVR